MGKKKQAAKAPPPPVPAKFPLAAQVWVKQGITDPDFPDFPLGGWAGAVKQVVHDQGKAMYLIEWNRRTLANLHPIYRQRCERDGLAYETMWLDEASLERDSGEPPSIDQPKHIAPRPLSMDNEDDRLCAVFGLTGDDLPPRVNLDTLRQYHDYLAAHLSLPFEGKLGTAIGPHRDTKSPVSVIGLLDPVQDYEPEETYGLICQLIQNEEKIEFPLADIKVQRGNANYQLVADYAYWFHNWQ